ncbi:ATP-binding protein [Streptomyces sp. AN091965]|uniref:ATP-binding protein n=1 Tax=Streptomyces sp. AN091965 TaxID=2927803 RepID=UPI001F60D540|nr:ATP-binding protein [Streptomyces sp. AN091965]MCI3933852.1 ATP-binding protein [Streptomyces sp. AN091965]
MPPQVQTPTPAHVFTRRINASPRGARQARTLARDQLNGWGIPYGSELSDAAAQIVAELAANAATHGRVPGRSFELRLLLLAGTLRIEASDTRAECAPPEEVRLPPEEAESGRGLVLVAALAEAWGVESREIGKTVWATLSRRLPSPSGV